MRFPTLLAAFVLATVPSGPLLAASPAPAGPCDTLSGMPLDQDYLDLDLPGPRYSQGRSRPEVAAIIAACRRAAEAHPAERRFPFRLGVALKHAGRTDEALAAFARARALGSVGGWDEAAFLLMLGNSSEKRWKSPDPKAGLALADEGFEKTGSPVIAFSRAYGLLRGPAEIRDETRGLAELRRLVEAGDNHARVALADHLFRDPAPERKAEAQALLRQAIDNGSGVAAGRLAGWVEDEDEAHRLYAVGVARGDAESMTGFGYDYEHGRGVRTNYERAREYYEMAALRGNLAAQYNLGTLHSGGRLGKRDHATAKRWLTLGVERDHPASFFSLGMMHDHGRGMPVDWAEARRLYERGAELGSPGALNNMGFLFEHGRGAPVDLKLAVAWYEKGVARGSGDAMSNLALLYQKGKGVPKDLERAFSLLTRSAERKSTQGTNNLGYAYLRGEGTQKDEVKARDFFRRADELGSIEATHNLAAMLEEGKGGERDNDQARQLFKKAAEGGIANAMYRYAMRVQRDADEDDEAEMAAAYVTQRHWLTRAIASGDKFGTERLAEMLADGIGGPRDPREALRLYRIAAADDDDLKRELAERLRAGRGVPRDPRAARALFGELDTRETVATLIEMMDRGEGGPRDQKGATDLLRTKVAGGDFWLTGQLARRIAAGIGARRDPAAARALLTLASLGNLVGDDAHLLASMRERGVGGPVDLPGAVDAYRKAATSSTEATVRLAALLRRGGPGLEADPAEARRVLQGVSSARSPEAVMARIEMLDRGEGGPADPTMAARELLTAIIARNRLALDLAMRPGTRLTAATRSAFVDEIAPFKVAIPKDARTSGPLVTPAMFPALGLAPAGRATAGRPPRGQESETMTFRGPVGSRPYPGARPPRGHR